MVVILVEECMVAMLQLITFLANLEMQIKVHLYLVILMLNF